jgi:hypothetical protein
LELGKLKAPSMLFEEKKFPSIVLQHPEMDGRRRKKKCAWEPSRKIIRDRINN